MTVKSKRVKSKKFCTWHIATKESPDGLDCCAHIHEARVFRCPYTSAPTRTECIDYEKAVK